MQLEKVLFIDRDGVINVDLLGDYIKSWNEFQFEPGAVEALRKITNAGYKIVIISNQAGIGDGIFGEDSLWDVHRRMLGELEKAGVKIHAAYYCLHGKQAGCKCRKPETGLFEQAARTLKFDKEKTFFIGDKCTDIEAGKRFGLKTIFVRTGHGKADESKFTLYLEPDYRFNNLLEAAGMFS